MCLLYSGCPVGLVCVSLNFPFLLSCEARGSEMAALFSPSLNQPHLSHERDNRDWSPSLEAWRTVPSDEVIFVPEWVHLAMMLDCTSVFVCVLRLPWGKVPLHAPVLCSQASKAVYQLPLCYKVRNQQSLRKALETAQKLYVQFSNCSLWRLEVFSENFLVR